MKINIENRRKAIKNNISYFLKIKTLMTVVILIILISTSFAAAIPGTFFSNKVNNLGEKIINFDNENDVRESESKTPFTYDPVSKSLFFTINFPKPNLETISIYDETFTKSI